MGALRLKLCHPLESRDGTLNADSKMKNVVAENVEGELVAVKRPGVTKQSELPPGLAQGLFSLNGVAYGIVNDKLTVAISDSEISGSGNGLPVGVSWSLNTQAISGTWTSTKNYEIGDKVSEPDAETNMWDVWYAVAPNTNSYPTTSKLWSKTQPGIYRYSGVIGGYTGPATADFESAGYLCWSGAPINKTPGTGSNYSVFVRVDVISGVLGEIVVEIFDSNGINQAPGVRQVQGYVVRL